MIDRKSFVRLSRYHEADDTALRARVTACRAGHLANLIREALPERDVYANGHRLVIDGEGFGIDGPAARIFEGLAEAVLAARGPRS